MAKFNPIGMAVGAAPLAIGGVLLYEGYFLFTGTDPYDIPLIGPDPLNALLKPFAGNVKDIIDSILALVGIGGGGGPAGPCRSDCVAPKVAIDEADTCECGCPSTITCDSPQILDEATCTCKTPPAGCTTTCTLPQVLDVASCTCKTPVTNPPPPPVTGPCVSSNLTRYPPAHRDSICDWCKRDKSRCRYCFCRDCTALGKASC